MKSSLRSLIHPVAVSGLVALTLTGFLYGDAVALPLFSDDLVQIPWLESLTWRDLWTSPSPYDYYRPLWYTLWRVWGRLVGGLHPSGLHLLNLIAHVAAAWLTGLLAAAWARSPGRTGKPQLQTTGSSKGKDLEGDSPACHSSLAKGRGSSLVSHRERVVVAFFATAIFAAFPFSRQAVVWPGALYNPIVGAMAAGALLAYDRGRREGGIGWVILALLLALLAPFNYETGMLVGPLVVLAEAVGWLQSRWRRRSWWPMAFAGLFVIVFVIWRLMRGAGVAGFGLSLVDLWRNTGYLLQGLTHLTAPLAQRLAAWLGIAPDLALWIVALPTLVLLAWSALRRRRDAFLLGGVWFVLFALPPLISMEADWFALAPRFLYMTATGTALIWTAAIGHWIARPRSPWHSVLTGGMVIILLMPAMLFIRSGMRLYQMAGESIWDAAEAAAEKPSVLVVNLPMRITPTNRIYPLGFEGITPLPARVTAEELAYVHTGIRDAAEAVSFGIVAADEPASYTYQLFGRAIGWEEVGASARRASAVYLTRYRPERIYLVEAGAIGEFDSGGKALARFGDRVTLLDAGCICDEAGRIHLTLCWRADSDLERDAAVFVHLLDQDGAVVAQADGYPLLGMLPFWLWQPGETVRDVRHFDPVPPGEYIVRLGLWELATGEGWQAGGHPDGVVTLPVHCGDVLGED